MNALPIKPVNGITSWIDGSQVYGSDASTNAELRTSVNGMMKVTPEPSGSSLGPMLPTISMNASTGRDVIMAVTDMIPKLSESGRITYPLFKVKNYA